MNNTPDEKALRADTFFKVALPERDDSAVTMKILKARNADDSKRQYYASTPKTDFKLVPIEEACPFCETKPAKEYVDFRAIELKPKQHVKKRWMTEAYHRRIQKKWDKRVGTFVPVKNGTFTKVSTIRLPAAVAKKIGGLKQKFTAFKNRGTR